MKVRFVGPLLLILGIASQVSTAAAQTPPTTGELPAVVRGNQWFVRNSLTTGNADTVFTSGLPGDRQVFGDWDGDGDETPGVIRGNRWFLADALSAGAAATTFVFGEAGDRPVAGDWDDDGDDNPGVVRGNTWFLRNLNTTGDASNSFTFGLATDNPIAGDWDGDGDTNPGVARSGACQLDCPDQWFLRETNDSGGAAVPAFFSDSTGPVPGDWDNSGDTTAGWATDGLWWIYNANKSGAAFSFAYGVDGDLPLSWRR